MIWRQLAAVLCAAASAGAWAQAADAPSPSPSASAAPHALTMRPLWELGIGVSGLRLPDYPGSDQHHDYLLPLPYFIYRGTWLKADRDGARALLFDSPQAKLDFSLGATAPVRSDDNAARAGMPNLPATLEIGPSLNLTLAGAGGQPWKLDLRLPLRGAVTLEHSPHYVGATFSPNLNLDIHQGSSGNIGLLAGPLFADGSYHDHFYGVATAYATPQRPQYRGRAGYAGWQMLASHSRRFHSTWYGVFVRYENLRGAAFEDSPLVRQNSVLSVGFGLAWVLATSPELVESLD